MRIIIKIVKAAGIVLFCAVLSIAGGLYWDHLAWEPCEAVCPGRPWLNYFVIRWLGPLIGADGEGAYDADMVEVMIHLFFFLTATWLLIGFFHRKRPFAGRLQSLMDEVQLPISTMATRRFWRAVLIAALISVAFGIFSGAIYAAAWVWGDVIVKYRESDPEPFSMATLLPTFVDMFLFSFWGAALNSAMAMHRHVSRAARRFSWVTATVFGGGVGVLLSLIALDLNPQDMYLDSQTGRLNFPNLFTVFYPPCLTVGFVVAAVGLLAALMTGDASQTDREEGRHTKKAAR